MKHWIINYGNKQCCIYYLSLQYEPFDKKNTYKVHTNGDHDRIDQRLT